MSPSAASQRSSLDFTYELSSPEKGGNLYWSLADPNRTLLSDDENIHSVTLLTLQKQTNPPYRTLNHFENDIRTQTLRATFQQSSATFCDLVDAFLFILQTVPN